MKEKLLEVKAGIKAKAGEIVTSAYESKERFGNIHLKSPKDWTEEDDARFQKFFERFAISSQIIHKNL